MTSALLLNNAQALKEGSIATVTKDATRHIVNNADYTSVIDDFGHASAIFMRVSGKQQFKLDSSYHFSAIPAGGFLGIPGHESQPLIWIPRLPTSRRVDSASAILEEKTCRLLSFEFSADKGITFDLETDDTSTSDLVIWQLTPDFPIQELTAESAIESHGTFLWGSHGRITQASDLYRHIIQGSVYDLRYSWPHNKKCFSENEAHALYTAYSGLEHATGKTLYRLFQQQLVLSVMQRQADDGAWYHGMWTDEKECHYRLHTSALHLLMDEFDRTGCPQVKAALARGVTFITKHHDPLDCGVWFLHDSLELTDEAMDSGPFRWISKRTLGKRPSNMLVLNTHLDTSIAINRYQTLTGDQQYTALIQSALASTRSVLGLTPANWLYKPLFWAIGLTLLPTKKARKLSAPIRAIKRITADYLIKRLPDIKARFPRLVMPNGYIDRELSLRTWAVDYQTINLMDLARYSRAFPGEFDEDILDRAMIYTHDSGLIQRYRELAPGKRYATGFWVEALYHRCLAKADVKYRQWLAEAMLECHDLDFGMAPSLLGSNSEAVPFTQQSRYPVPANPELNIAVLNQAQGFELLIVNHSQDAVDVRWDRKPETPMNWCDITQQPLADTPLTIPPRQWVLGSTSL
ncbi:MAG: hypothetical protein AB9Q17_13440 [Candidatus Reddybacter sp.]